MLRKRILTACLLLPFVYLAIYHTSVQTFEILVAVFLSLASLELLRLAQLTTVVNKITYFLLLSLLLGAAHLLNHTYADLLIYMLALASLVWLCIALFLIYLQKTTDKLQPAKGAVISSWFVALLGLYLFFNFALAIVLLKNIQMQTNTHPILFVFLLIFAADSSAYFVGRQYGKHKLCETISPGKTWQGVAAALLSSVLLVLLLKPLLSMVNASLFYWLLVSILVVTFSIVGDLYESYLKRRIAVKDSGSLLPGHGGLLDRIDSLLAAVPIFAFGMLAAPEVFPT